MVIAGDSAGAILSMGVSLLARDRGEIKKRKKKIFFFSFANFFLKSVGLGGVVGVWGII